jgi:hypothetical protein
MIEDYLKRHGLTKRDVKSFGQWIPAYAVPVDRDQIFEIYANDNGTHVVVIDRAQKKFKIVHGDLLHLESDWKDAQSSYDTEARPFWKDEPAT